MIDDLILNYKPVFAKNKYDVGKVEDYVAPNDLSIEKCCSKISLHN